MKKTTYILGAVLLCVILFAENAYAASFLEEEAGISAYVNVGSSIDLNAAKTAFQTIEYETTKYIIGSLTLPGLEEWEQVHVYVSSDGWIVAYYPKNEPTAKIMRWSSYTGGAITTTRLEDSISKVCDNIGASYSSIKNNVKYYHFQYPEANRLEIIADRNDYVIEDSFAFMVPSNYILYEASWSHYASIGLSKTKIDGVVVSTFNECKGCRAHGFYTESQVAKGIFHTVSIYWDSYWVSRYSSPPCVAVALVYKEP